MEADIRPPKNEGNAGLGRQAVLVAASKTVAVALAIILPLFLVRRLSQAEFGLYKQAFQVLMTALSLLGLQFHATASYLFPRRPEKRAAVVLNILLFYSLIGSGVAALFAAYPQWVRWVFKNDDLAGFMPMLGLAILLWLVSASLEVIAIADRDVGVASALMVFLQVSKTALLLGAGIFFGTVRALVNAAVIQGVIQCAILLAYQRRRFGKFPRGFDWPLFKAQLGNALPFGVGALAQASLCDLHNYYVSHYYDASVFALYAVGCFQLPFLTLLIDSIGALLIPEIARIHLGGEYRKIAVVWFTGIRRLAFCYIPACAFLLVMRHEFIVALFTPAYLQAAPILALNLCNVLLSINMTGAVFRTFEECRFFRLKLTLALLPVTWVALYFGISRAGLLGAVGAMVFVNLADVVICTAVLRRRLGLGIADLAPLAPVVRMGAAAGFALLPVVGLRYLLASFPALVSLGACAALFGATYFALAVFAGSLTPGERAELRNMIATGLRRTCEWAGMLPALWWKRGSMA